MTGTPRERAAALLSRMTVAEKANQLVGILPHRLMGPDGVDTRQLDRHLSLGIGHVSAVGTAVQDPVALAAMNNAVQRYLRESTRLRIPAILHNEALNGVVAAGFTAFPTPIGLAATWSPELVEQMAVTIRRQLLAVGVRQALAPVLDVARDARWGRVHETYGEEVALVAAMGVAYVRGLQGADLGAGVLATAKHFLGYAMTEGGMNLASTHFGPRELFDVYAAPFAAAIDLAGLRSVMNSYSDVDGVAVGASRAVLTDLLRGRLGLDGTVVSDYQTVQYLVQRQRVATSAADAGALALAAGLDVELPTAHGFGPAMADAVAAGVVPEAQLDRAVLRVLTQKFELGLFDNPYVDESRAAIEAVAGQGRALSAELAGRSVTLLKNADATLPFDDRVRRVAVIGPHADSAMVGFANYTYPAFLDMIKGMLAGRTRMVGMENALDGGTPEQRAETARQAEAMATLDLEQLVRHAYGARSLAEAIDELLPDAEVVTAAGTGVLDADPHDIPAALAVARDADVVVLALGGRSGAFGTTTEGEGSDSADIDLPARQRELALAVAALGRPTAAVLYMGRPFGIAAIDEALPAILTTYYPGPEGAVALARVLFGHAAPAGKLPFTLPRHTGQVPIYQAQKRGSGYRREPGDSTADYADLPSTPLYAFGHGLSYTEFDHRDLRISPAEIGADDEVTIELVVADVGPAPGAEVVQVYLGLPGRGVTRPAQQLVAFARVELDRGAEADVRFTVRATQLGHTGLDGRFVVEPGPVAVAVGAASDDVRLRGEFRVVGEPVEVADRRSHVATAEVTIRDHAGRVR